MKKLIDIKLTILANLVLIYIAMLSGCSSSKPTDWDVKDNKKWEIWAKGTIVSITDVVSKKCSNGKGCSNHWTIEYEFDNNKKIYLRKIKNPGTVSVGQKGILYKHMSPNLKDKHAWFQWIEDSFINPIEEPKHDIAEKEVSTAEKIETFMTIEPEKEREPIEIIKHDWQKGENIKNLDAKEIVLIVLDDGIITTGFITYDRLWKLGSNINTYKGGKTLANVFKWKKIDLE